MACGTSCNTIAAEPPPGMVMEPVTRTAARQTQPDGRHVLVSPAATAINEAVAADPGISGENAGGYTRNLPSGPRPGITAAREEPWSTKSPTRNASRLPAATGAPAAVCATAERRSGVPGAGAVPERYESSAAAGTVLMRHRHHHQVVAREQRPNSERATIIGHGRTQNPPG
jgi:hypothetical protein